MFQSTHHGELELLRSDDADIYLQGAHLTRFRDWLFVSSRSKFARGQGIRGGVPVIFPWFGPNKNDPNALSHGLVRTQPWQIENVADDAVTLRTETDAWRARMFYGFGDELRMRFEVENLGDAPLPFECALHTYYAVQNARDVVIEGLDGKTYLDKTENYARKSQSGAIELKGETDRVYLDANGPVTIGDGARTISITGREGWRSTVVWNPWERVAAKMSDLDDEWTRFVCVECGAIADDAITLAAGDQYALEIAVGVISQRGLRPLPIGISP